MLSRQDIKDIVDNNIIVYDTQLENPNEVTTRLIALMRTVGRRNECGDLTEIHVPIGTRVPNCNKVSVTFDPRLNKGGILYIEYKSYQGAFMEPYTGIVVMTGDEGKLPGFIL